jgi:hypothetical protein
MMFVDRASGAVDHAPVVLLNRLKNRITNSSTV